MVPLLVCALLSLLGQAVCDFNCLCNFAPEIAIYAQPTTTSRLLGYMYEYDCNEIVVTSLDASGWHTIAVDHQPGYVNDGPQLSAQECDGDPPLRDVLTERITQPTVPHITSATKFAPTLPTTSPTLPTTSTSLPTTSTTMMTTARPTSKVLSTKSLPKSTLSSTMPNSHLISEPPSSVSAMTPTSGSSLTPRGSLSTDLYKFSTTRFSVPSVDNSTTQVSYRTRINTNTYPSVYSSPSANSTPLAASSIRTINPTSSTVNSSYSITNMNFISTNPSFINNTYTTSISNQVTSNSSTSNTLFPETINPSQLTSNPTVSAPTNSSLTSQTTYTSSNTTLTLFTSRKTHSSKINASTTTPDRLNPTSAYSNEFHSVTNNPYQNSTSFTNSLSTDNVTTPAVSSAEYNVTSVSGKPPGPLTSDYASNFTFPTSPSVNNSFQYISHTTIGTNHVGVNTTQLTGSNSTRTNTPSHTISNVSIPLINSTLSIPLFSSSISMNTTNAQPSSLTVVPSTNTYTNTTTTNTQPSSLTVVPPTNTTTYNTTTDSNSSKSNYTNLIPTGESLTTYGPTSKHGQTTITNESTNPTQLSTTTTTVQLTTSTTTEPETKLLSTTTTTRPSTTITHPTKTTTHPTTTTTLQPTTTTTQPTTTTTATTTTTTQPTTTTPATTTTTLPTTTRKIISGNVRMCPSTLFKYTEEDKGALNQYDDRCFELVTRRVIWTKAESDCQAKGGHLIYIESRRQQEFVYKWLKTFNFNDPVWIGLTNLADLRNFRWMSGYPLYYTNWFPSKSTGSIEKCVVMVPNPPEDGAWRKVHCGTTTQTGDFGEEHSFLCEYSITAAIVSQPGSLVG